MTSVNVQESCRKCNVEGAQSICNICKKAVYCDDICGAEDWEEHIAECNVVSVGEHVDFIMAPEGFRVDEETPDYVVQCPNPEGTAMVEYALSEIGLRQGEKDVFFPSKEKKKGVGGVSLDFKNKAIGITYGFSITVTDFNTNDLVDTLVVRGLDLKKDIVVGTRRSGVENEVVLTPDVKAAVKKDSGANLIDFDTSKSLVLTIQLFQNKQMGSEIVQKVVFDAKALLPPGKIFSGDNAIKRGGSRLRTFFRSFRTKNRGEVSSTKYNSKMQGSIDDVKIAMVFVKGKDYTNATLYDIYFKIPPRLFRRGEWADLNPDSQPVEDFPAEALVRQKMKADPYDLVDVTDLCIDLEDRIEALGDLIGEEQSETYKREYLKHLSRAKHYLSVLKPHQAQLQAGIGSEFEPEYKVLTTIDAVQEMEHIDAFFSVSVKKEKKKELERSRGSNLRTLIKTANLTVKQGAPKVYEGKFGKIKSFGSKTKRRARGYRKKFKGRLLALQELIQQRRNDQPPKDISDWPMPQDVQDTLDMISEALFTSTA